MDIGLGLLLASIASPVMSAIFGGNKQKTETPFKGWMSPSLGMQDPYLLNSVYKRGMQYGVGDPAMYDDIMRTVRSEWPRIMDIYRKNARTNQMTQG